MKRTIRSFKKGIRLMKKSDRFASKVVKWFFIGLVVLNVLVILKSVLRGI